MGNLFIIVAELRAATFLKQVSIKVFSCDIYEFYK